MAKGAYIGQNQKSRKVKRMFVGAKSAARKVKKGYVGVGNVARLFFSAEAVAYTGNFTVQDIIVNGAAKKLYTLISSGTLTLSETAQVWLCGGGSGGRSASGTARPDRTAGCGGGGGYVKSGNINPGVYPVVIGNGGGANANGSATSVGNAFSANGGSGVNGGSGGGGAYNEYRSTSYMDAGGTGAGVSTIPFGVASLYQHCAGGGGGLAFWSNSTHGSGGCGGENGARGYGYNEGRVKEVVESGRVVEFSKGGVRGGGDNDNNAYSNGGSATFYGSGGAGGKLYNTFLGIGGSGYQGVAYILVAA